MLALKLQFQRRWLRYGAEHAPDGQILAMDRRAPKLRPYRHHFGRHFALRFGIMRAAAPRANSASFTTVGPT